MLIPKEIIEGRRGQSTMYVVVDKKLMTGIANQMKILYAIVSTDA